MTQAQCDTMDRNPIVVNPHSVQNIKVEQNLQHLGNHLVQQAVQQQSNQIVHSYIVEQPQGFVDPFDQAMHLLQEQPSPTGFDPCFDNMPGEFDFGVSFDKMTTGGKNKYWDVSKVFQFSSFRSR